MRKNRKVSQKRSVVMANTLRLGSLFVMLAMMVIVNMMAASNCSHLMKQNGDKKRELSRLEDTLQQEQSRWEAMTTPEKLEMVLLKRGMSMSTPKPWQVVRVNEDGSVPMGQYSVARIKQHGKDRVQTKRSNGSKRKSVY